MKLDGAPPGVASPSSSFRRHSSHHHRHHTPEPPEIARCAGGWAPSPREEPHHGSSKRGDYEAARSPLHLEQDRPPLSFVVVRGMPPLPYAPPSADHTGSHWEPAVARSYQPPNGFNGSEHNAGLGQVHLSASSFRLQPRAPTVTRSNGRGCRGRKRTAGGISLCGNSNAAASTTTPFLAGSPMTVISQHLSDQSAPSRPVVEQLYPEVGLGLKSHCPNTDVAGTPSSEPRSPHVIDSTLITLRSLSLRSPGGPGSPSLHEMLSPANSIKRPRGGSSFTVYSSSPAGSLPSASSTRPFATCNSARSSPRVVPLTVLMGESTRHDFHNQPTNAASTPAIHEIKTTPTSRPPLMGVKIPRESLEKQQRILDRRSAAVSFESPVSNEFRMSPCTPLPRITLTPRSNTSREDSVPAFPSHDSLDKDKDDDDEHDDDDDGLPKFWLDGVSPIALGSEKQTCTILVPEAGWIHRPSPRQDREGLMPPPPLKYPLAPASKFQCYGSSNSLALSADGSQDLTGQQQPQMMSPMDDTRTCSKMFLPYPHWLDSSHSRRSKGDMSESPGTPLSSDSRPDGRSDSTDLLTPQRTNRVNQAFPLGIEEEEEEQELMFGANKTRSLLSGTSNYLLAQTMFETNAILNMMDAETGSLSDSDDDETFLLVSPKEIAEEQGMYKRARFRRQWIGDSKFADATSRRLSLSSEGASNTSLFGMNIAHDEASMSRLVCNPSSVSATSFPSEASEATSLCRRRSDGSLGSPGLSLEIAAANTNSMDMTAMASVSNCTGRDLVTPPILATSKMTDLSPPPFAPKQDSFMRFAEGNESSMGINSNYCIFGGADRQSVVARIKAAADLQDPLYDGGVDDDDDDDDHQNHAMMERQPFPLRS